MRRGGAVLFVLTLAALLGLTRPLPARACSIVATDPRTLLAEAKAAFVGTVVDIRPVKPRIPGAPRSSTEPTIFTFRVEDVVKGKLPSRVEVRSVESGASCGIEVERGNRVGLLLDREDGHWHSWLGGKMTPSQLRAAARPLPTPVRGRAAFLVGGRFGDGVRTIALNTAGSAVAYGRGGGITYSIATCPEGRFAVEVFSVGRREMVAVRRVADLHIVRQLALPAERVFCRDADARTVVVFKPAGEGAKQRSTIGVLHGRRFTILHRGRARSVALHGGSAYFLGGGDGRGLYRLDLDSRVARRTLTLPLNVGQPSISPNGRWLSAVAYSQPTSPSAPPSRLVLADLRSGQVRTRALARSNIFGDTPWVGAGRFLFIATTGDGDVARVFDTDFRVQARLEDFDGRSVAVSRRFAVALGWGGLVRAPLTGGRGRVFRTFLSPETFALAVVPPSRA